MKYLILLNCKLIECNVRECFLFWCKKTHKVKEFIKNYFPHLYLNQHVGLTMYNEFTSCDIILVSKRYIYSKEFDSKAKMGKLLGYLSADQFENLDKNLITYSYTFYAYIDGKGVALFNELSQIKLEHTNMLNKIKKALDNGIDKIIPQIERVILEERIFSIN